MFLPQNKKPRELWGRWFSAKRNAVELARKEATKISGKAVYFSSVTDPYQPAERAMLLTRGILREMQPFQPRVVIQTRGTLVTRDIDILCRFRSLRVNLTMGSDSERVRELLEPKSPTYEKRWEAARQLADAGISLGLCITPVLPLENPERFAERIASFGAKVVVTQGFHDAAQVRLQETAKYCHETCIVGMLENCLLQ
jgi:DNA repair photolyase